MRCLIGLARIVIVGATVGAVAAGAFAQERAGEGEQVQKNKPVLAGPTVRENRFPGVEESFGGADRMRGMSERPVPMRIFRRALGVLVQDGVSEQHRLSEEQEQTLRQLGEAHARSVGAFMAEHAQEIAELRKAARAQSDSEDRDVQPQRGSTDVAIGLRRRIAQIRRMGPSDSALQTKLWNVLDEGQQALVEVEIDTWRQQMAQDRMDQLTQRYLDERREAGRASPTRRDPLASVGLREGLSPRLRTSIAKLEPKARRRLIERLRKRWNERQEGAGIDQDDASGSSDAPKQRRGGQAEPTDRSDPGGRAKPRRGSV